MFEYERQWYTQQNYTYHYRYTLRANFDKKSEFSCYFENRSGYIDQAIDQAIDQTKLASYSFISLYSG